MVKSPKEYTSLCLFMKNLLQEICDSIASHTPEKYLPIVTRDTSSSGIPIRVYMQRNARPDLTLGDA